MLLGIKFVDISFALYMKCYPRIPHFLKTFLQILIFFSPHTLLTFLHDSDYNQVHCTQYIYLLYMSYYSWYIINFYCLSSYGLRFESTFGIFV